MMTFSNDLTWIGPALAIALLLWVRSCLGAQGPRLATLAAGSGGLRQLGPYTLEQKLGEGAMGEVYRAWHATLGSWRALKLLPPGASDAERRRFEREARLGAELRHPNAVSIYERGEGDDGTCYYAMELLEGVTLAELVERDGPQPPARVARIALQLCAALSEAHARGLLHRDVKPENVLLTGDGADVVKLIDFGLVQQVGERSEGLGLGAVVGTPLYLSPEAIAAPEAVGPQSDLYALGAVMYFLLKGAPVFEGRSIVEVCGHHLHSTPAPLAELAGSALEQVVMACLAKEPGRRPASAEELARRLSRCLEPVAVRGEVSPRRAACLAAPPEVPRGSAAASCRHIQPRHLNQARGNRALATISPSAIG